MFSDADDFKYGRKAGKIKICYHLFAAGCRESHKTGVRIGLAGDSAAWNEPLYDSDWRKTVSEEGFFLMRGSNKNLISLGQAAEKRLVS